MTTRPIKAKEIVDRVAPRPPAISADGTLVALEAAPWGYKGKSASRAIWVSRNGEPARKFTSGKTVDSNPAWSPNGSKLAFLSNRNDEEKSQIFVISMDGGEASALGDLDGELSHLRWSPDGAELAVLRRQPETKRRKKRNKKRDDAIVVDGEPRYNRIVIVDSETGKSRKVDSGEREIWDYAWSLDGAQLAYATADATGEDAPMRKGDIWLVGADGKVPRHITELDQTPTFLTFVEGPNGPALTVRKNGFRDHPAESIHFIDLESGTASDLLPEFPGNVDGIAALPAHTGSVAILTAEGVHSNLYRLDVSTKARTSLLPASLSSDGAAPYMAGVSADGSAVALLWSDSDKPDEIYLVRDGGEPVAAHRVREGLGREATAE